MRSAKQQPTIVPTRKACAELLGVTGRQLGTWSTESWFPPDGRTSAGWNVTGIAAARNAQDRKGSDNYETARRLANAIKSAKLKQEQIKTLRMEREESLAAGDTLPREVWTTFAAEVLIIFRDQTRGIPARLARLAPDRKTQTRIKREGEKVVDKNLRYISDLLRKGPTD